MNILLSEIFSIGGTLGIIIDLFILISAIGSFVFVIFLIFKYLLKRNRFLSYIILAVASIFTFTIIVIITWSICKITSL